MSDIEVGDFVFPVIGPYKNQACIVIKIEFDSGAASGWFTVRLPNQEKGLFTGNELRKK